MLTRLDITHSRRDGHSPARPFARRALAVGVRIAGIVCLAAFVLACEPNNQGYAPEQPVKYSHAVHAGANQIPCQYCHYSADKGRFAGIPPAGVCMNCHQNVKTEHPEVQKVRAAVENNEPIKWKRVHFLPDHATFDHSVHVNGGVECQTCHGPIQEMAVVEQWAPLTMGWCLDCHREKGIELAEAGNEHRAGQLTDCVSCHH